MEESSLHLSRAFSCTVKLLRLELAIADPSSHIQAIRSHVSFLLSTSADAPPPATLTPVLLKTLRSFHAQLSEVVKTASSLSALVARTKALTHLSTPATACGLFLLSLEAEQRTSLPNCGDLAKALGMRFNISGGIVMERYRIIYELVEKWIEDVPWLQTYERTNRGRSKVAKRVIIARGLKDVVQFQEELWKRALEAQTQPELALELDEREMAEEEVLSQSNGSVKTASSVGSLKRSSESPGPSASITTKRRRTRRCKQLHNAAEFLLSPLSIQSTPRTIPPTTPQILDLTDLPAGTDRGILHHFPLLSHMLAADDQTLSISRPPTRLQVLTTLRGGSSEDHITDDELFATGELEGLLRDAVERDVLKRALGWDRLDTEETSDKRQETKRKRDVEGETQKSGTTRIDMNAYTRLMMGFGDESFEDEELDWKDVLTFNEDSPPYDLRPNDMTGVIHPQLIEEGVELEDWRPPTPEGPAYDDTRFDYD
jgi:transcription factor IIIB 90 kDa subunit